MDIGVMGEFFQHQVQANARPRALGLSRQYPWIGNDAFLVHALIFFHIQGIIAHRGHYRIPVGVVSQLVSRASAIMDSYSQWQQTPGKRWWASFPALVTINRRILLRKYYFSWVVVSAKLMSDSTENSGAIFISGGEP